MFPQKWASCGADYLTRATHFFILIWVFLTGFIFFQTKSICAFPECAVRVSSDGHVLCSSDAPCSSQAGYDPLECIICASWVWEFREASLEAPSKLPALNKHKKVWWRVLKLKWGAVSPQCGPTLPLEPSWTSLARATPRPVSQEPQQVITPLSFNSLVEPFGLKGDALLTYEPSPSTSFAGFPSVRDTAGLSSHSRAALPCGPFGSVGRDLQ